MSAIMINYFCIGAIFMQTITAQCLRNSLNPIYPTAPINDMGPLSGACGTGLVVSNSGGLSVTSASPIAPTGLVVTSENAVEGQVAVGGQLPLIGSVAMDGAFPSAGAGAISYGCGDGSLGILSEGPSVGPASAIATTAPIITATGPSITPASLASPIPSPTPALASSLLGSSCRFGPGKSPFGGSSAPGQTGLGPRNPVGRGSGLRH